MSKKRIIILTCSIIVLVIIGIIMATSYAREDINTSVLSENEASEILYDYDNNYAYFTVKSKDDIADVGAIFAANLKKVYANVSGKTISMKVEKSTDNNSWTEVTTKTLTLGSNAVLTVSKIEASPMYYRVSLYANDIALKLNERNVDCSINVNTTVKIETIFKYSDDQKIYTFNAPYSGNYVVELWGAAGNYYPSVMSKYVGKGAYTKGTINLASGTILYVYTGQNATKAGTFYSSAFNAGSTANGIVGSWSGECGANGGENCHNSSSGGGATDVRLVNGTWNNAASLASRIMVAGGGGGTQYFESSSDEYVYGPGGSGGGLVGYEAGLYGNYFGSSPGAIDYTMGKNEVIKESDGINTVLSGTKAQNASQKHDFTFGGKQTAGGLTNYANTYTPRYFGDLHSPGNPGKFGVGGSGGKNKSYVDPRDGETKTSLGAGGGGGGGYYGGGGGGLTYFMEDRQYITSDGRYVVPSGYQRTAVRRNCHSPGAGGSSYISGHTGSIAIKSATDTSPKSGCTESGSRPSNYVGTTNNACSIHYSGMKFTNTLMIDGEGYSWTNKRGSKVTMPSPDGRTMSGGNPGSGAARITYSAVDNAGMEVSYSKESILTVTARYVDNNGTALDNDVTNEYKTGATYTTEEKTFPHYHLLEVQGDRTGTVNIDDITVVYVYELDKHTVVAKYVDVETGEEIADRETQTLPYGTSYTTEQKEIRNYTFERVEGEPSGTLTEDRVVIYYYLKDARVVIRKIDGETGNHVPGALLVVKDTTGNQIATWETNEQGGYCSFDKLGTRNGCNVLRRAEPNKTYILEEIRAPKGYASSSPITFTLDENNVLAEDAVMVNNPIRICISVVDVNHSLLSGAKVNVVDSDNKNYETFTSTDNMTCYSRVPIGDYTLNETKPPAGYDKPDPVEIEVLDTSEIQYFEIVNLMKVPKTSRDTENIILIGSVLLIISGAYIVIKINNTKKKLK